MLVDGTGLLVRCSRSAASSPVLTAPDGTPTGALTRFIGSLSRTIREVRPERLVIAWDGEDSRAWRQELWPGYKADRLPVTATAEGDQAREFCAAAGMFQIEAPGFEADDIIAAVTRLAPGDGPWTTVICSDDQDLHQMASPWTCLRSLDGKLRRSEDDVRWEWQVEPYLIPRVRALAGDPSDGIPGLPGVGILGAIRVLVACDFRIPPPESILPDPEQREMVTAWYRIMDLIDPPRHPSSVIGAEVLTPGDQALWSPERASNVTDVLNRYGMIKTAQRHREGGLW